MIYVAVVLGLIGSILGVYHLIGGPQFGATVNYSSSLGQTNLYNEIESIVRDVQNTNAPLAGMVTYSSSTFTIGTEVGTTGFATSTISSSTAGASALAGILPGDFVMATVATTSAKAGLNVSGLVTASDTLTLYWQSTTSSFPTGNVSLNVRILPAATWKAAAAVITVTSTSN